MQMPSIPLMLKFGHLIFAVCDVVFMRRRWVLSLNLFLHFLLVLLWSYVSQLIIVKLSETCKLIIFSIVGFFLVSTPNYFFPASSFSILFWSLGVYINAIFFKNINVNWFFEISHIFLVICKFEGLKIKSNWSSFGLLILSDSQILLSDISESDSQILLSMTYKQIFKFTN